MTDPQSTASTRGNTDPDELARFARLSQDWWNPHGNLRTLHAINPVRLAFMEAADVSRTRGGVAVPLSEIMK